MALAITRSKVGGDFAKNSSFHDGMLAWQIALTMEHISKSFKYLKKKRPSAATPHECGLYCWVVPLLHSWWTQTRLTLTRNASLRSLSHGVMATEMDKRFTIFRRLVTMMVTRIRSLQVELTRRRG